MVHEKRPVLVGRVGERVAESLVRWQDEGGMRLLAFVIMPDHVHVLGVLTVALDLGRAFGRWKAGAGKEANQELGRTGRFWQPGFYDHGVRRDEDLREIARYIEGNPVRKGFVSAAESFMLSSASERFRGWMRGWGAV